MKYNRNGLSNSDTYKQKQKQKCLTHECQPKGRVVSNLTISCNP